ncbi:MAG: hypothetical protein R3F34_20775 [Planctomycetota bacterium]
MTDAYVFVAESFAPVKGLTGFKKGVHGVPQEKSAHGDALVARLAEGELAAEREERASALRSAFGFKRKELEAFGPEDGVMTLATPLFDYEVQVDVDPDDPSRARTRRRLLRVREPERIDASAFAAAFGRLFLGLEFRTGGAIDVAEVVDAIEDRDDESIDLDYDTGLTRCAIAIRGVDASVEVTPELVRVASRTPCDLEDLVRAFARVREVLAGAAGFAGTASAG